MIIRPYFEEQTAMRKSTRSRSKRAKAQKKNEPRGTTQSRHSSLVARGPSDQRPATSDGPPEARELLGPLAQIATNAWRLKVRMIDAETGEPKEQTAKLYRFVEGLFRALDEAGIQVVDKTGKPYDEGMPEKVISFEQTPGLAREQIIDTVRPTIRWRERPLCNGEIIVGLPVI
jgi:hypothetical protein